MFVCSLWLCVVYGLLVSSCFCFFFIVRCVLSLSLFVVVCGLSFVVVCCGLSLCLACCLLFVVHVVSCRLFVVCCLLVG